jgi:hypothetical protein
MPWSLRSDKREIDLVTCGRRDAGNIVRGVIDESLWPDGRCMGWKIICREATKACDDIARHGFNRVKHSLENSRRTSRGMRPQT